MDYKVYKAIKEKEKAEFAAKPWFYRWSVRFGEMIWYRIILRIPDLPREFLWKWQECTRGYSDCDIWSLDGYILRKVRQPFKDFYKYQSEHGHSLPFEFQTDPAAWLVVLSKIEYAFDETWKEDFDINNYLDVILKMTKEQSEERDKKIQEGFELFGKYLRALWD